MSHRAPNGAQEFLATKAINILLLRSKSTSSSPMEQKHLIRSAAPLTDRLASRGALG
jgi:hypothetical protein